ncbi:hypothetical protein BLNAU_4365 [Blattamonas nauphoetae]|uniref:Uncharacterized protein n=1 Tax=Blattamonas nauphoetae TaxID=2049346 RepID=A0ABQ9WYC3_9EUKA|nr:hypothetical protein BLNAU_20556 [Blattamonas nauphoetae]KAK2960710.1 hypothetical protein BLNAU_4365 [Blattamonas nauphoetae]
MGRTTPTLDSDLIRKLSFVLGINPQPYLSVKPSTALQMLCELLGCGGPRRTLPQLCKYIRYLLCRVFFALQNVIPHSLYRIQSRTLLQIRILIDKGLDECNFDGQRDLVSLLVVGVNFTMTTKEHYQEFLSMEETNDVDQIRVETSKSAHDTIEALIVSLNTVPTESNSPSFIPLDDSLNQSDARDG